MSEIRIEVIGKAVSGKSTIMLMIEKMLLENGVTNVTVVPHLESIESMKILDEDNDMKEEILTNLSVTIKEIPE